MQNSGTQEEYWGKSQGPIYVQFILFQGILYGHLGGIPYCCEYTSHA